ncbi:MAG: hypothetical protein Q7S00_06635 [bacterium]|nr:hypothetical protein [bacterium]
MSSSAPPISVGIRPATALVTSRAGDGNLPDLDAQYRFDYNQSSYGSEGTYFRLRFSLNKAEYESFTRLPLHANPLGFSYGGFTQSPGGEMEVGLGFDFVTSASSLVYLTREHYDSPYLTGMASGIEVYVDVNLLRSDPLSLSIGLYPNARSILLGLKTSDQYRPVGYAVLAVANPSIRLLY